MRKTLIQTLLAAFSCILAHAPLEEGGVMLIGMRNAMLSGGWKNPYVTDGLVAMWDGIENAGWGVHDPNATVWKDLVGNIDLVRTVSATRFNDNSVYFNGGEGLTKPFYSSDSYGNIVECAEIVYGNCRMRGNSVGAIFSHGLALYPSLRVGYNGIGFGAVYQTVQGTVVSNDGLVHSLSFVKGISYRLDGGNQANANISQNAGDGIFVVGNIEGINRGAEGIVCCIRLYSAIPTYEQRTYNYAVDKARFNLP